MASRSNEGAPRTKFGRMLTAKPLTLRRAGFLIATTSFTLTVAGGLAAWLLDPSGVGSFGDSIWWAMQTVTTVGYGDVVPEDTTGRIIGAVLMLNGIAVISVTTAVVTAALMEQARRRRRAGEDEGVEAALARIESRLARIEASLSGQGQTGER
jgi:voltage-gated potassium channel Kch